MFNICMATLFSRSQSKNAQFMAFGAIIDVFNSLSPRLQRKQARFETMSQSDDELIIIRESLSKYVFQFEDKPHDSKFSAHCNSYWVKRAHRGCNSNEKYQ